MPPAAHESQNTEWKESWRDEYIKWLCGFANAQGGTLTIGVNDQGQVVGIANGRQLLEEIPNKVRVLLGILVDVHSRQQGELTYLKIVEAGLPVPHQLQRPVPLSQRQHQAGAQGRGPR